jgi:transcriptional regulator with XRE-family HTH domain
MTADTTSADPTLKAIAGNLLRDARRRLGLTQAQFAERVSLTQSKVSEYESGRRQPTLATVVRLIEAAGLELRLNLSDRDRHDEVLAASLALAPQAQAGWEADRDRWVRNRKTMLALEEMADLPLDRLVGSG